MYVLKRCSSFIITMITSLKNDNPIFLQHGRKRGKSPGHYMKRDGSSGSSEQILRQSQSGLIQSSSNAKSKSKRVKKN